MQMPGKLKLYNMNRYLTFLPNIEEFAIIGDHIWSSVFAERPNYELIEM